MGKPGLRECVLHHPLDLLLVFLLCSRDQGSFLRELAGIPYQGQFLLAQRLRGWELIKLGLSRSHDCGKRAVRDSSGPVRCRRPNSVALAVGHNLRCWFAGSLSRGRRVTRCQRVRRLARSPSQGQRHDEHRRHRARSHSTATTLDPEPALARLASSPGPVLRVLASVRPPRILPARHRASGRVRLVSRHRDVCAFLPWFPPVALQIPPGLKPRMISPYGTAKSRALPKPDWQRGFISCRCAPPASPARSAVPGRLATVLPLH